MFLNPTIPLDLKALEGAGRSMKVDGPADLAVEQPRKFGFAINLKTAKVLGLTTSPSVLARADHIVE